MFKINYVETYTFLKIIVTLVIALRKIYLEDIPNRFK